jgi:hypothetical protein
MGYDFAWDVKAWLVANIAGTIECRESEMDEVPGHYTCGGSRGIQREEGWK